MIKKTIQLSNFLLGKQSEVLSCGVDIHSHKEIVKGLINQITI